MPVMRPKVVIKENFSLNSLRFCFTEKLDRDSPQAQFRLKSSPVKSKILIMKLSILFFIFFMAIVAVLGQTNKFHA